MLIDLKDLTGTEAYHLMTQSIIPRPVAWVLTENEGGDYNLAPFSFFTAVCSTPPIMMFSVGNKPSGEIKDTRRNIERTKEFVLHIAHADLAVPMTETSRTLAYGESELERVDLQLTSDWSGAESSISLPRLKACTIAMHCALYQVQEIGDKNQGLIFGEIKHAYVADSVLKSGDRLQIDADKVDPIARLGASEYASLGEVFSIARPE